MMASPNLPPPQFRVTLGERASLWFAFAEKAGSEVMFLIGNRLSGKSFGRDFIGYLIDTCGCFLHEAAHGRTVRLVERWEARK